MTNSGGVSRHTPGQVRAKLILLSIQLIADLWDANKRGIALAIFSLAPFAGPAVAPIVSRHWQKSVVWRFIPTLVSYRLQAPWLSQTQIGAGYSGCVGTTAPAGISLTSSTLPDPDDLRWSMVSFAKFQYRSQPVAHAPLLLSLVAIVLLLPETYVPYILHKEAKRLRKETGDDRWHSPTEHPDHKVSISETLHHTVLKPFIMLVQEPMLFALTLYLSFVYGERGATLSLPVWLRLKSSTGIVYLLFSAVPLVFQQNHGWNSLVGGLAFLGLPIGGTIATLIYALYFNPQYVSSGRSGEDIAELESAADGKASRSQRQDGAARGAPKAFDGSRACLCGCFLLARLDGLPKHQCCIPAACNWPHRSLRALDVLEHLQLPD